MFTQDVLREEPLLTKSGFSRLLEWLDDGVASGGERYLEMRRRLVSYFDRRNRLAADDLADETLNRISRTLEKDGAVAITPPARYCYLVARFVLLEDVRRARKERRHEQRLRRSDARIGTRVAIDCEEGLDAEERLACLERCLHGLTSDQRALVIEYYSDGGRQKIERRRAIAKRLGITMNALSIRVSRIRARLEATLRRMKPGTRMRQHESGRQLVLLI